MGSSVRFPVLPPNPDKTLIFSGPPLMKNTTYKNTTKNMYNITHRTLYNNTPR
jgi:hypothetical protein